MTYGENAERTHRERAESILSRGPQTEAAAQLAIAHALLAIEEQLGAWQAREAPAPDEPDDAIHILREDGRWTLCGQRPIAVLNTQAFEEDPPDGMAGCWMCLQRREYIRGQARVFTPASAPVPAPLTEGARVRIVAGDNAGRLGWVVSDEEASALLLVDVDELMHGDDLHPGFSVRLYPSEIEPVKDA